MPQAQDSWSWNGWGAPYGVDLQGKVYSGNTLGHRFSSAPCEWPVCTEKGICQSQFPQRRARIQALSSSRNLSHLGFRSLCKGSKDPSHWRNPDHPHTGPPCRDVLARKPLALFQISSAVPCLDFVLQYRCALRATVGTWLLTLQRLFLLLLL